MKKLWPRYLDTVSLPRYRWPDFTMEELVLAFNQFSDRFVPKQVVPEKLVPKPISGKSGCYWHAMVFIRTYLESDARGAPLRAKIKD